MPLNISVTINWRHLQLLSRDASLFTVVAEMEVSPQEEMTNPQGMKVFAVEMHGLYEDSVSFRALCGVQSSLLAFAPTNGPLEEWQVPGETLCFRLSFS